MSNPAVVIVHKWGFYLIPIDDLMTSLTLLVLAEWYSSTKPNEALKPSSLLSSAANTFSLLWLASIKIESLKGVRYLLFGSICLEKAEQNSNANLAYSLLFAAKSTSAPSSPSAIRKYRHKAAARAVFPFFLATSM